MRQAERSRLAKSSRQVFRSRMERDTTISVAAARRLCAGPLVLLLAAALQAGCGGSSEGGTPSAAKSAPSTTDVRKAGTGAPYAATVISRVQPRQLAAFALLRTPPEGLPTTTRRILSGPAFGINWNLAQLIPVKSPGAYWLVPGNGHLCVISKGMMGGPGVGTTCAATAYAIAHGIADISIAPPNVKHRARLIVGVVPIGTREVIVQTHGSISATQVHHGAFVLRDSILAAPNVISLR